MNAHVLDMPDEGGITAGWLEERIVGPDLHELVAELVAVHGPFPDDEDAMPPTADDAARWLGADLDGVLEEGLARLPAGRLGELLRTPALLPALQELAFVSGGRAWQAHIQRLPPPGLTSAKLLRRLCDRLPADDDVPGGPTPPRPGQPRSAARAAPRMAAPVSPDTAAYYSSTMPTLPPGPRQVGAERGPAAVPRAAEQVFDHRSRPGADAGGRRLLAVAAGLLVAAAAWALTRGPAVSSGGGWGWSAPGVLAAAPADEYLERLAAAGAEWFRTPAGTEAALAGRLDELLAGCDRLIAAPHAPLAAADRDWLVEKCRTWRDALAGQRTSLAAAHDVAATRAAADETVAKLVAALRRRAAEIRTRPTG